MYTPSKFIESRLPVLHALIRAHPFASIIASTPEGVEADHLPLLLDSSRGAYGVLQGHVARENPIWKKLSEGSEVLVIFQGPSSYVSPSWYPSKQQHGKVVPTWNYVVVHVRGCISWHHDPVWLRQLLERLTHTHESGRSQPWQVSDAPADYVERMLGAIVGFELPVSAVTGKWKLGQNRSVDDRAGVVSGLEAELSTAATEMAEWMRELQGRS